jgi:hypothetical protein
VLGGGHPVVLGANAPSHPSSNGELTEPLVKKPNRRSPHRADAAADRPRTSTQASVPVVRAKRALTAEAVWGAAQVKTSSGAPGADARLSAAACAAGGCAIAGAVRGRRPARRAQAPRTTRGSMPAIVPSIDRREPGRLFGTNGRRGPSTTMRSVKQRDAAIGAPALGCGRGSGARVGARASRCRRPGASSRRLGDAASTVGQAH